MREWTQISNSDGGWWWHGYYHIWNDSPQLHKMWKLCHFPITFIWKKVTMFSIYKVRMLTSHRQCMTAGVHWWKMRERELCCKVYTCFSIRKVSVSVSELNGDTTHLSRKLNQFVRKKVKAKSQSQTQSQNKKKSQKTKLGDITKETNSL